MNLNSLTEGQRQSVLHVGGPLLISAGAGSGKTFTLTQRIAHALTRADSSISDIDEVLAITFTEKAAGEIKARVKNTLRNEGLSEQALKVDGAWISTIHAMCSRILRSHALDLGIDPGFGVIDEAVRSQLITEAIDEALGDDNEIISRDRFERLFDEFPARSAFFTVSSVASMLELLLGKAASLKGGLDEIVLGPIPQTPKALARELLQAYEALAPSLEQAGTSNAAQDAKRGLEEALACLNGFLLAVPGETKPDEASPGESASGNGEGSSGSLEAFAQLLDGFMFIPAKFGNAEVKATIKAYQQEHARIINEVILGLARPMLQDLLALARDVAQIYEEKKQMLYVLDNDDLLAKTLQAFKAHPAIASFYAQKFKLLMVDEFQDTSQIQIDIIEELAGENKLHLCTVGDSQQSIYRFRGADVNVYEAHKQAMRSSEIGALSVELNKNFRSHRDVLSFVDRIFEQPQVFGDAFMSLTPDDGRPSHYCGNSPRIDLVLAARPSGRNTGVGVEDSSWVEARAIAKRFEALRKSGHNAGDMVVLLGKMNHADIFAQALREQNFECVITGGSLFAQAPEVHVVCRLVEVLANPAHTAALFEVLASDMFKLGADDFLELSTMEDPDGSGLRRSDLHTGFSRFAEEVKEGRPSALPLRLKNVVCVLNAAWNSVKSKAASQLVKQVLLDSGWLTRLGEQGAFGIAQAGNILKAVRMLEALEDEFALGPAQLASEFSDRLNRGLKEAPGALTGRENQVVKIMTIHASKGLEFPIVALADFYGLRAAQGALLVESCKEQSFASLSLCQSFEKYPKLAYHRTKFSPEGEECFEGAACDPAHKQSLAEFRAALKLQTQEEELAEARRKFYVGLTRASEALIISVSVKTSSRDALSSYKDIVEDLRSALCGREDFPSGKSELAYGGGQAAAFERIVVSADEAAAISISEAKASGKSGITTEISAVSAPIREGKSSTETALISTNAVVGNHEGVKEESFAIPLFENRSSLILKSTNPLREKVFSYSSLATTDEADEDLIHQNEADRKTGKRRSEKFEGERDSWHSADVDKATQLGTAFHRLAQYAIETGLVPAVGHIDKLSKALSLTDEQKLRLYKALDLWFSSKVFSETASYSRRCAETPFYLRIGGLWLEGEIDLLCTSGKGQAALVVDYKTGGKLVEKPQELHKKHLLQASCYAYAVLSQGYPQVNLKFVRVEQTGMQEGFSQNPKPQPQVVEYSFNTEDIGKLKETILVRRKSSSLT